MQEQDGGLLTDQRIVALHLIKASMEEKRGWKSKGPY